jgi:hypothetical protein
MALIDSGGGSGTWCVADRDQPTLEQLVETISAILGQHRTVIHLPAPLAEVGARMADLLTHSSRWSTKIDRLRSSTVVDGTRLDQLIGFEEPVVLKDALALAVSWTLHAEKPMTSSRSKHRDTRSKQDSQIQ